MLGRASNCLHQRLDTGGFVLDSIALNVSLPSLIPFPQALQMPWISTFKVLSHTFVLHFRLIPRVQRDMRTFGSRGMHVRETLVRVETISLKEVYVLVLY